MSPSKFSYKKILLGMFLIVTGASVLVMIVTLVFIPTPGEAIIKYALPAKKPQASSASPLTHSGATDLTIPPSSKGQTRRDAAKVLVVMEAIERDVMKGKPRDICAMLGHAPQSAFFEDDKFSQHLFELLERGRERNTDPMGESVLRAFEFFKNDPELPALVELVREELRSDGRPSIIQRSQYKARFIWLVTTWGVRMSNSAYETRLRLHLESLTPQTELTQFLHENPQFAQDKDFVDFCYEIPRLKTAKASFEALLKKKKN